MDVHLQRWSCSDRLVALVFPIWSFVLSEQMIYKIADVVVLSTVWTFLVTGFVIAVAGSIHAFGWWSIAFWAIAACFFVSAHRP